MKKSVRVILTTVVLLLANNTLAFAEGRQEAPVQEVPEWISVPSWVEMGMSVREIRNNLPTGGTWRDIGDNEYVYEMRSMSRIFHFTVDRDKGLQRYRIYDLRSNPRRNIRDIVSKFTELYGQPNEGDDYYLWGNAYDSEYIYYNLGENITHILVSFEPGGNDVVMVNFAFSNFRD